MQEADVLLLILNRILLVIARSICHTATCTNSAILSAIARLPSIKCSLQEATYLSKGRMVVCPVVPELASSFNWCGSQNLVVSVALSSSRMYGSTSPVTQCSIFYRRQVCSSVSLFEGVFDITSIVSMERIPWTNQEQDI